MQLLARHSGSGRKILAILAVLALTGTRELPAGELGTLYPRMAPIERYLMDRNAEIALARSAAPEAISRHATVLVLGRHGYETAVRGNNGFVCMVERGWVGALDSPEMWNPRIRGADCLNAPASRSILPLALLRTRMLLAGHSPGDVAAAIRERLGKAELPPVETGAMSYMMAKDSYLTDAGAHNGPHVMFFIAVADASVWGAGVPGSPVGAGPYWSFKGEASLEAGLPPINVFTVSVRNWSDGTTATRHIHELHPR
jgi:hypothetical protein